MKDKKRKHLSRSYSINKKSFEKNKKLNIIRRRG